MGWGYINLVILKKKIKKVELIAFSIIRRPRKRKRGGLRPVSDVLPLRKRTSTPYNTYSIENATLPQHAGMTRLPVFIISNCTTNPPSSRLHPSKRLMPLFLIPISYPSAEFGVPLRPTNIIVLTVNFIVLNNVVYVMRHHPPKGWERWLPTPFDPRGGGYISLSIPPRLLVSSIPDGMGVYKHYVGRLRKKLPRPFGRGLWFSFNIQYLNPNIDSEKATMLLQSSPYGFLIPFCSQSFLVFLRFHPLWLLLLLPCLSDRV